MKERSIEIVVFFNGKWNDRLKSTSTFTTDVDYSPGTLRSAVRLDLNNLLDGVSNAFLDEQFNKKGE